MVGLECNAFVTLCFRDRPLALYVFSNDKGTVDYMKENTSSGGFCANDTVIHAGGEFVVCSCSKQFFCSGLRLGAPPKTYNRLLVFPSIL